MEKLSQGLLPSQSNNKRRPVELGKAVFTESRRGPGRGHTPDTRVAYRMGQRSLAMAETKSRPAPRAAFALCARHVVYLGGASPLRAEMTGTASRSKGVRREAESEGSVRQNSDLTNRNRIEGQRSGVTRQWTGRPNSHPGTAGVNPAGTEGKRHDLPWEVSVPVWEPDYRDGNRAGGARRSQQRP